MRIHILSALLGVTATLLAVALLWPGAAPTTHAQSDGVVQLDPEWNNVAYGGDPLPIEQALNDALGITDTVWLWRSLAKSWDSWTQGALELLNSLGGLDRGDVVWMRTSQAGLWTQLGAAQEPGAAGLNCWDLNGNGVFDAATEDTNGDGVADALDCRGDPGLPGRACWDLNANGEPDPAEDIDGDGTANALDCRGPAGTLPLNTDSTGGGLPHNNTPPNITVNCIIATQGLFPSAGGAQPEGTFLGEVQWFAGTFAPRGWTLCDGQLLLISQNTALFALLGTTYGGDGQTTFALPDARGRSIAHAGSGPGLTARPLGQRFGTEVESLTESQIPPHTHPIP